ncbi:ABC transporter permease [Conexibacter sp. CPCC 206217]|uniref:ABC transporter permease n=1 Tax=Conexibacter sp. CPCC 206217 TaxID=3064574 RepID=UPI00271913CF|nr:ABC transporter permease [Conexibacter sp. CPCC 206217]MDO8210344.1 ABC transporter permease [Conexibacter sp. CPCC 206217]
MTGLTTTDLAAATQPGRPPAASRRRALLRQIALRLLMVVPVVLGVITLIFLVGALSKRDPARAAVGPTASAAQREAFAKAHGLDDPLPVRYVRYLGDLARGDLSVTLVTQEPIGGLVKRAAPVTVSLTLLASALALLLGLVMGVLSALHRGSPFDRAALVVASVGHAVPAFLVGLVAIQLFAVNWHVIPSGGYSPLADGVGEWLRSLIAPALVLALPFGAVMARVIRGTMVQELDKEYVRTAEGLGLPVRTIVLRNVLRNALSAPLTQFGVGMGVLFSGAILIESLFQLPGLGMLTVQGIQNGDFGLVSAVGIFGGIAFVLVNAVIDVICALLDPKGSVSSA